MDARELRETIVTPVLGEPLPPGRGAIFCATMQLAWDALASLLGGPVALEGDPPLARALAASPVSKDDVDAASAIARAGEGPAFLAELADELARSFGAGHAFGLPERLGARDLLAYAYLAKDLAFETPFAVERKLGVTFAGQVLPCFGLWPNSGDERWDARAKQVTVHDYRSDTDFVIELATKSAADRLILARIARPATLGEGVAEAMRRAPAKRSLWKKVAGAAPFSRKDVLKVPLVSIDVVRKYDELVPRQVQGRSDMVLGDARQAIRFALDEKGAILRSSAALEVLRSAQVTKRAFVFDGPFLVALARAGREIPYFAAWIETPELLAKPAT